MALVDLLDRMLTGGVVLTGDLVLSITDIDLVKISLRAVVVAAEADSPWALTSLGAPDAGEDLEVRRRDPA
ncbi:gas vesicle protein [Streptomyces sp. NPDC003327]